MSQADELYQYYLTHKDLTATELAAACNMQKSVVTMAKKKYGFETAKKWKYQVGEKLGPYNIELLKQLGNGSGKFRCPRCGESFVADYDKIISGRHKSCGCGHVHIKDITNQRFGRLVALEFTGELDNRYSALWSCQCDCGNTIVVPASSLTKEGGRKSCGCLQRDNLARLAKEGMLDLTLQRFGKLTALYRVEKNGKYYYHCLCDCGNEIDVQISSLTTGKTRSCGCVKSKGETVISSWLKSHSVIFIKEKTFKDCINLETGYKLRFDFYLPLYNICIEYDGIQHTIGWNYNGSKKESLEEIQKRDRLKDEYCEANGIPLYRISYLEYNNIETRLEEILKEISNG